MPTNARFEFDSQAALEDPPEAVNRKRTIDVFHSRIYPNRNIAPAVPPVLNGS